MILRSKPGAPAKFNGPPGYQSIRHSGTRKFCTETDTLCSDTICGQVPPCKTLHKPVFTRVFGVTWPQNAKGHGRLSQCEKTPKAKYFTKEISNLNYIYVHYVLQVYVTTRGGSTMAQQLSARCAQQLS